MRASGEVLKGISGNLDRWCVDYKMKDGSYIFLSQHLCESNLTRNIRHDVEKFGAKNTIAKKVVVVA